MVRARCPGRPAAIAAGQLTKGLRLGGAGAILPRWPAAIAGGRVRLAGVDVRRGRGLDGRGLDGRGLIESNAGGRRRSRRGSSASSRASTIESNASGAGGRRRSAAGQLGQLAGLCRRPLSARTVIGTFEPIHRV